MHSINNINGKITDNKPFIPDVLFHPGPVHRTPPKPIIDDVSNQHGSQSSPDVDDIHPNINFDFEKKSPFQEGVMSKFSKGWTSHFFEEPKELGGPHK